MDVTRDEGTDSKGAAPVTYRLAQRKIEFLSGK